MQTVAETIWDFQAQPMQVVDCNLCGEGYANPKRTEALDDRYGFAQKADRCKRCDLVYLNPRMTREAYARFYETAYRPLVSAFHGREINAQTIKEEQRVYGQRLGRLLSVHVPEGAERLLDVGGSTGVVAKCLGGDLGIRDRWVLEPSTEEGKQATARGCYVRHGTIEDFETPARFPLITLCQTADHLLDLMGSLKKIRGLLTKDGLFWSDIVDFDKTREVKIDHPFNLTERTYREFLKRAGFDLLQVNFAPDGVHIGFLAR
jgi:hypothetical protein